MKINYKKTLIYISLLLILLLPWVPTFLDNDVEVEVLTDDLGFYQTYTCQISLFQFELNNLFTIYQDHYRINLNNYSDVPCYGKLTGLDRVGNIFYISIGMHPLITLIIQTLFLLIIIMLLKKDKEKLVKENLFYYLSIFLTPLLITFGFYSQTRYYQRNFLDLDFRYFRTYFLIYIFTLFCTIFLFEVFNSRAVQSVNCFPFLFIFIGVPFGLNLYIYFFIFITLGIYKTLISYKTLNKFLLYLVLIFIWITSVNNWFGIYFEGNIFYLKPDKMVGFINTVYSYESIVYSSLLLFFIITGINFCIDRIYFKLDIVSIKNNFYIVAMALALLSFFNTELQLLNTISQIYLGQNKESTRDLPNGINDNWRGFFPSAEQMGEFYALVLILVLAIKFSKGISLNKYEFLPISISALFLILSNNRSAIFLTFLFYVFLYLQHNFQKSKTKLLFVSIPILVSVFIYLLITNQLFSYSFSSQKILLEANSNVLFQNYSKSLTYLNTNFQTNSLLAIIFGLFSTISLYINRSYLWGLYFARYNPTTKEFLFGTGPFHLSNLYNEIEIQKTSSFLWPHSSLLQAIFYFGIIGVLFMTYVIVKKYKNSIKNDKSHIGRIILLFLLINLFKSDSILYFSTFFTTIFFYCSIKYQDFKIKNH